MGTNIRLKAEDGHELSAYLAEPAAQPHGGIVVLQEFFGVTSHIRNVCDQYAAAGYRAIAPALFDRIEPNVDIPYTDMTTGFEYVKKTSPDTAMLDVQAAVLRVRGAGKVGVVGYCWGGTMAYLAAARLNVDAVVSYYGGMTTNYLNEHPKVPVLYHFGERDTHIPASAVAKIKAAHPEGIYQLYPAGHGFNCTDRASFDAASAKLAFERSVDFFRRHVG
jgi:carboxymethylenebutenolidase